MTYQVLFDVSQRLPQLAVGIVAMVGLVVVTVAGLFDVEILLGRWALVLGFGAACVGLEWLVTGEWPYILAGAIVIWVVVALDRAGGSATDRPGRTPPGAASLIAGVVLLILAVGQGLPMVAAIDLQRRLAAGEATIIEGPATVEDAGKEECLVVDGQRFCYSESTVSPGYNRRRYIDGPLHTGLQLRLSVLDGLIVRLEVGSEARVPIRSGPA